MFNQRNPDFSNLMTRKMKIALRNWGINKNRVKIIAMIETTFGLNKLLGSLRNY